MATLLARKGEMLEAARYWYDFEHMLYVNLKARKAFSVEFVEDHPESEIRQCINESTGGNEWRFYFNAPPAPAVRRELERVLG